MSDGIGGRNHQGILPVAVTVINGIINPPIAPNVPAGIGGTC
jgi:hypothetical protein